MSVRNSFASLDESDEETAPQVKSKAKTKAPAAPITAPARYNNNRGSRRDGDRRDNRRDNRGGQRRDNRGGQRRGEYNRDVTDSGDRKYRRDDRRQDRRRDADRRDRRRDGNNQDQRRGRNQYEKTHQKRGPKKGGHGGWGTDKDAVDVVEESAVASPDTPTEEATDDTPSEPAAPAVQELTLEEHEAAEKERRAKFNERWASNSSAGASKEDLAKEFSGMAVVSKKSRKPQTETWASARKVSNKSSTKSAQKAKELKKAIFAEPTHFSGGGSRDYGRGSRDGRGRGGGRGGRGRGYDSGRGGRGGRDNQRGGGASGRRYDVDTQDVNEFPAL